MDQSSNEFAGQPDTRGIGRRRLLLSLAGAGGAFAATHALPRRWTKPLVDSVVVPLHAQASDSIITGNFTTNPALGLVGPQTVIPLGSVVVGDCTFQADWILSEDSYVLCVEGTVGDTPFSFAAGPLNRSGNSLADHTGPLVGGASLQFLNQVVDPSGPHISFTASWDVASTPASALPGAGVCATPV